MSFRTTTLVAIGLLFALSPRLAHADEGERIFSIHGGFASFSAGVGAGDNETTTEVGGQVGIDYERGLTRAVWLRTSLGGALYTGRPSSAGGHATVGLTYVFDVLRYIPYGHVGLGGAVLYLDQSPGAAAADNGTTFRPLVELGLGLDILGRGDNSWGIHFRVQSFLDRTALVVLGARYSWRWGFF